MMDSFQLLMTEKENVSLCAGEVPLQNEEESDHRLVLGRGACRQSRLARDVAPLG